jgi:hypothetical protein
MRAVFSPASNSKWSQLFKKLWLMQRKGDLYLLFGKIGSKLAVRNRQMRFPPKIFLQIFGKSTSSPNSSKR